MATTPNDVSQTVNPMLASTAPASNDDTGKPAPKTEAAGDYAVLPKWQFFMVFVAMCLSCFLAGLDGTIVVTAMPKIAKDYDALSSISWIIVSFMLTQTALTPLWGRLVGY